MKRTVAFSLVTRDGRRLVRRGDGAEAEWALVPESELPPGTPPPRRWTVYGVKSAHSDIGLHRAPAVQRANAALRLDRVLVWTNPRGYIGGVEFGLGTAFIDPPSHPFPEQAVLPPPDWAPDMEKWEQTTAETGAPFPRERFDRAWKALFFTDDHSYGFSGYSGTRVYETWEQRRSWIEEAERAAAPANVLHYTRDRYASWSDPAALGAPRIASSVRLATDRKAILIENEIVEAADLVAGKRLDRFGHYAFPFALDDPRFAAQLNGPVVDPFRDVLPHVANSYCAIRDWCAVEDGSCGVALVQPDTWVMEFGRQHGREAYGREDAPASAAMWSFAFSDGLRWHWKGPPSFRFRETHGIAVRAALRQNLVPGARPVLCDLLERPIGPLRGGFLELAPFAFATVLLRPDP